MTAKSVLMRLGTRTPTYYATGVSRGYPALWGKSIFAPLPTKTADFEVKSRRGRSKNRTFTVSYFSYFLK